MANIKRGRDTLILKLPSIKITKDVLCNVEKIILKRIKPTDHWVTIEKPKGFFGNEIPNYDWASDVPDDKEIRWASVRTKARSVRVDFTPRITSCAIQRLYARGEELNKLNEIYSELSLYLSSIKKV